MGHSTPDFQSTALHLTQASSYFEELCPYGQPDNDQDAYWLCCKSPPRAVIDSPVSSSPLIYNRVLFISCPSTSGPLSFELRVSNSSFSASNEIYFPEQPARNADMSFVRGVLIVGKTGSAV
jgi:hypothetical protein